MLLGYWLFLRSSMVNSNIQCSIPAQRAARRLVVAEGLFYRSHQPASWLHLQRQAPDASNEATAASNLERQGSACDAPRRTSHAKDRTCVFPFSAFSPGNALAVSTSRKAQEDGLPYTFGLPPPPVSPTPHLHHQKQTTTALFNHQL